MDLERSVLNTRCAAFNCVLGSDKVRSNFHSLKRETAGVSCAKGAVSGWDTKLNIDIADILSGRKNGDSLHSDGAGCPFSPRWTGIVAKQGNGEIGWLGLDRTGGNCSF
jgi:hypothetical protein